MKIRWGSSRKRLCPYTGKTLEYYRPEFYLEPAHTYEDYFNERDSYSSRFYSFDFKIARVKRKPLFSDFYAPEVYQLMRYEWGYSNSYDSKTQNYEVLIDKVKKVGLYYDSMDSIVMKNVNWNKKRGRHVKAPSGIIDIPSPDIEDFEEKLKEIQQGDTSRYNEKLRAEKEIAKISRILANTNLTKKEQLKAISQLF